MRTAIMGTGSLGTILGAHISTARHQIDLIDTFEAHINALNKNGATVIGTKEFNVPVKACTPDNMDGIYDLVFFMVKQTCNEAAIAAIKPHIHDKTIICTLQNGLPEYKLAGVFGEDRVLGCIVGWGATFRGPGISELTSDTVKMSFDLGRIDGKITDGLQQVKKILECMCPTHIHENLMGIRWSKMLINSTFSAISALTGCCFGDVPEQPELLLCAQHIGNECLRVAEAYGIQVEPSQETDVAAQLKFNTDAEREKTSETYRILSLAHRRLRASMLQDLEKGRKCEIDFINGFICNMGKTVGVPTPVNSQIVELIHEIEDGRLSPTYKNAMLIRIPALNC